MTSIRKALLLAFVSGLSFASACAQDALDFSPGGPIPDEALGDYHVVMECAIDGEPVGAMTIEFWPEKAPVTVRNFLRYAAEGFYDGKKFHRIMRDFMIQGGDPNGDGSGNGPHGTIPGEFSDDPRWGHHYGVISMARTSDPDSASCQFFICCAETASVWGLDGKYASFGKLAHGVDTLEKLANAEVTFGGRERSKPTGEVQIVKCAVVKGEPEEREPIERPLPDLGGEPAKVTVQHVLIAFKGASRARATRSKEEAEKLAAEILERARSGEDFEALVRKYSDDPPREPDPGVYTMTNHGVTDVATEKMNYELGKLQQELIQEMQRGEISREDAQAALMARQQELLDGQAPAMSRGQMIPAFGDVSFKLKVGEVGMAPYDAEKSPYGWHIIKRLK